MNMKQLLKLTICLLLILVAAELSTAQKPELIVQTGHSSSIEALAFSPDGKLVGSVGGDAALKLWEVNTGRELRTLKSGFGMSSVTFSPDSKIVATGNNDTKIKFWDVHSGEELRTLSGHAGAVASIAFSPNGKIFASASTDNMRLWDAVTGQELRKLIGHAAGVRSIAFSPNGELLASGSDDKTIKLWDVGTGKEQSTLIGHASWIYSVAFSPDGKLLVSASDDKTLKLWDVATGKELRSFTGATGGVFSVAFSPDGKTVVSGDWDHAVKLWDVATGKQLRTLSGHTNVVNSVAFSADGKLIASSGSNDQTIKLWDAISGKELRTLRGRTEDIHAVAVSSNGKIIAAGGWNDTVKFWNASTGQALPPLGTYAQNHTVESLAISADGGLVVAGSWDPAVRIFDVSGRRELHMFTTESTDNVGDMSVALSPDARIVASADWNQTIKLLDSATGKELRALIGHQSAIACVAYSPDGKTIASGGIDNVIKLWDATTGKELRTLKGHTGSIRALAFSSDGKLLVSGSEDKLVKLWEVATGKDVRTLSGHTDKIGTVAFSRTGVIASGSFDNTIKLWDASTGRELRTLQGSPGYSFSSLVFSPDGKIIVSANEEPTTRLWDVNTGKELARLINLGDTDWLVITPDGLFDGSPASWNQVLWRYEHDTFNVAPIEWFFNEFYYPGLLADIFAGKRPQAPHDIAQKDRRQPQIKMTMPGREQTATAVAARTLMLKIEVADAAPDKDHQTGSGAIDMRLFRNGSLVKVWRGDVLQGKPSATFVVPVPLVAGANDLMAYAFNRENVKSKNASLLVNGAESLKRQGTAYILAVGVNAYSNQNYNLKYAVADAQDFSAEVKRRLEAQKRYAHVEVVSLLNENATKANLLSAFSRLAGAPEPPTLKAGPLDRLTRAEPEDAVIVYFAGHGTAHGHEFYLIPHDLGYDGPRDKLDETGLQAILAHSISDRDLEKVFEGIDAGQLLLVIDACNSGQALEAEETRRGPMNSKGLAQLAYEKGMYILTAAQSYQAAQEAAKFGHGFLTYALVEEGLKQGAADREPKTGTIDVRKWLNYATDEVPRMQEQSSLDALRGRGRYVVFVGDGRDVGIPKSDAEARDNVQRPRVFYRRELESNPLVVAILGAAPP
jgi:WD40 repeat protein/uncharacterized caspase-like protein